MREFLRKNRRLPLERLPASSPHLNLVEAVWSWFIYGRLAKFVAGGMVDLDDRIPDRLTQLRIAFALLRSLWEASEPPISTLLKRPFG